MKVIILAAGYGTRLQRDIEADKSGAWSHLVGVPKPLLPVGNKPLISHWMERLEEVGLRASDVHVVVNLLYHDQFVAWAESYPGVHVLSDGTTSNKTRTGAVGCIRLAVKHFSIDEDILVIGGDTLFMKDFCLGSTIKSFESRDPCSNEVVFVDVEDSEVHRFGIIEIDTTGLITGFMEKPKPTDTPSRKCCPCFYIYGKASLPLLDEFLAQDLPLEKLDAPGHFLSYLFKLRKVFATKVSGRYDVGSLESYIECAKEFE